MDSSASSKTAAGLSANGLPSPAHQTARANMATYKYTHKYTKYTTLCLKILTSPSLSPFLTPYAEKGTKIHGGKNDNIAGRTPSPPGGRWRGRSHKHDVMGEVGGAKRLQRAGSTPLHDALMASSVPDVAGRGGASVTLQTMWCLCFCDGCMCVCAVCVLCLFE